MPAREFLEWIEYERIEPFGQWRDNWHAALIASLIANANRRPGAPPVQIREFMYVDPQTDAENKDAEMIAFLDAKVRD
jgi:hypothetical protein